MEQSHALEELKSSKSKPFWGFWATTGFGAIAVGISFILQGLTVLIFLVNFSLSREGDFAAALTKVESSLGSIVSAALVLQVIVGIPVIISFVKLRGNMPFRDYVGLRSFKAITLLVWLPINFGYLVLSEVVRLAFNIPQSQSDITLYTTSNSLPMFFIGIVIFAPAFEEVLFRGFMFRGYFKSIGPFFAIILTAAMWAILHISSETVVYDIGVIFIGGLLLGLARWKTGSLWITLAMHAFWNLLAFIAIAISIPK